MSLALRPSSASLEEMNFLQGKARRETIHARDRGQCFYCLCQLTPSARCLDHVVPQALGGTKFLPQSRFLRRVQCAEGTNCRR